jgi:hypothetical protein
MKWWIDKFNITSSAFKHHHEVLRCGRKRWHSIFVVGIRLVVAYVGRLPFGLNPGFGSVFTKSAQFGVERIQVNRGFFFFFFP